MTYPEYIVSKYGTSGILLDTNVLLLLLVGEQDVSIIPKFKRTKIYSTDDFASLKKYVNAFSAIVTTPNILTEVSNLADSMLDDVRTRFFEGTQTRFLSLEEHYFPSRALTASKFYLRFGLSDSSVYELVKAKYPVVTDDLELYNALIHDQIDALNINHFRSLA